MQGIEDFKSADPWVSTVQGQFFPPFSGKACKRLSMQAQRTDLRLPCVISPTLSTVSFVTRSTSEMTRLRRRARRGEKETVLYKTKNAAYSNLGTKKKPYTTIELIIGTPKEKNYDGLLHANGCTIVMYSNRIRLLKNN